MFLIVSECCLSKCAFRDSGRHSTPICGRTKDPRVFWTNRVPHVPYSEGDSNADTVHSVSTSLSKSAFSLWEEILEQWISIFSEFVMQTQ